MLDIPKVDILLIHGWVLWVAWGILGMIQIISIRYTYILKICDKLAYNMKIAVHIVNGIAILILTIIIIIVKYRHVFRRVILGK